MGGKDKDILISYIKFPMIYAGLWPQGLTKNPFLSQIIYFFSRLAVVYFFIYYISLMAEMLRLLIYRYETQVILASFSVCINGTKIAVKVIIYVKNNVFKLFDDISHRERDLWEKNDNAIIKIYLRRVQTCKLFSRLLWVSTWAVVIGLNIAGAYGMEQIIKYNQAHNASIEPHFTYQFWFPGNKLEHKKWAYIINILDSFSGLTYNLTSHMALITVLTYAASQLEILQHRLKHYIPENLQENQMGETIQKLKELIREHQYLIGFTKTLNDSCKNIIMMEFILSSFDAASVTISMLTLQVSEVPWLIAFLILLVIQIFCLAWSCNEVNFESRAIADAAFESKWRLLNKDGKRLTQLLIQRAQQRPLVMTIGPFGPMTLQSFLTIWRAAYSYITIMRKSGK